MFNYGVYKKQVSLNKNIEKIKKDYMDEREKRRELNSKLSLNYKKRVENFVINMLENPLVVNDYKGVKNQQIREEEPIKFKADAQIYVKGFKHEKDRIYEATEKNKDLDFHPNQSVASHQYRVRDINKEIQPDMRFKDKTSLERIESFLKDHTQTQVENMDFTKNKKAFKFDTLSESMSVWEKRAFIARQIAKNLLPSLHQKTHFQAAQTMYNNLPRKVTLCDSAPKLGKSNMQAIKEEDQDMKSTLGELKKKKDNKNEQQDEQETKEKGKSKGDQLETFNPVQTSKQVLQTCNILGKKNKKVKSMSRGDGHLISTLDRSISETYLDLYNIDLHQPNLPNQKKFVTRK